MTAKINLFAGYWVYITDNPKKYNRKLKEVNPELDSYYFINQKGKYPRGKAVMLDVESGLFFGIFFRKDAFNNTVIHECVHVVEYLMEQINIKDDEFKAILIGYLADEIIKSRITFLTIFIKYIFKSSTL